MGQTKVFNDLDIKVQIGNLQFNILYINYEPPLPAWSYKRHCHSSYELHYIPSGRGILEMEKNIYHIVPGTFYITGPWVYHSQQTDPSDPMCEYCINFEIRDTQKKSGKNRVYAIQEGDEILKALQHTEFWFGEAGRPIEDIFKEVIHELENNALGSYTIIQNLISYIIVKSARSLSNKDTKGYSLPKKILNDKRRLVVEKFFMQCSNPNLTPKLTPGGLADNLGISVRQLNRVMLEYYSITFKEKLNSTRVEVCADLLANSDMSILEISEKLRFSSSSYFCRLFKDCYGITPSEYRENSGRRPMQEDG